MTENTLTDIAIGLPLQSSNYGGAEMSPFAGSEMSPYGSSEMESGLLPLAIPAIFKQTYCKRVCRSLGYEKKEKLGGDKGAFLRCKSDCLIHFKDVKKGKYKIKPAEPGASVDLAALDKETAAETGVKAPTAAELEKSTDMTPAEAEAAAGGKSNTMMYIIIAVVALVIIVGAVLMMRKKSAQ
jgi:hypothetical protein